MGEKDDYASKAGDGYDNQEAASVQGQTTEYNLTDGVDQLERGLKSRHIQFLALGTSTTGINAK